MVFVADRECNAAPIAGIGSPMGSMATVRIPGSARQSGTVDGAIARYKAKKTCPHSRCIRSNTRGLPVAAEDVLHRADDLAECRSLPGGRDDQLHQIGVAGSSFAQLMQSCVDLLLIS